MIKVCTGVYSEVVSATIDYDGDYLSGRLRVRVVANGMDNVHDFDFGDSYGDFVQDISPEVVRNDLVPKMQMEMINFLKDTYGFTDELLQNLLFNFNFTK